MAGLAIVFGTLLSLLGGGVYAYTGMLHPTALIPAFFGITRIFLIPGGEFSHPTALIPAFFGIPLILLGVLALREKARMHAMHAAALIGLIGFAVPAFMVAKSLIGGAEFEPIKHGEQIAMSLICLVFLALCVKSFIDARRRRKAV